LFIGYCVGCATFINFCALSHNCNFVHKHIKLRGEKTMGYGRGNNCAGNWSGRGPFSHLPPWQRPGYLYGRGACWHIYGTPNMTHTIMTAEGEAALLKDQKDAVETQIKAMQLTLEKIQARLNEINK
jgi:hypothetical protein